jgi:ubiquinone/menaquinone biosynthesis C-methylase UbiE
MIKNFNYDNCRISKVYDESRSLSEESINVWLEAASEIIKENLAIKTTVDLGCGTGRFTEALYKHFNTNVIGVDPSKKQLDIAIKKFATMPNITFLKSDAEHFLLKEKANIVFMSMVYHHLPDKKAAIENIKRNLNSGGYVIIRNATIEDIHSNFLFDAFTEAKKIELSRMDFGRDIKMELECQGFKLIGMKRINQIFSANPSEYLNKVSKRGLSALRQIEDESFKVGIRNLENILSKFREDKVIKERFHLFVFKAKV